jgi:hypothetical protein
VPRDGLRRHPRGRRHLSRCAVIVPATQVPERCRVPRSAAERGAVYCR